MFSDVLRARFYCSVACRKLFVGGLSWETTQENLQRYFQRYGEVIDCVVMKNNDSGRSRGFGFVTYGDSQNVGVVLQNGPHNLDGRTIDPKPCNPRTLAKPKKGGGYPKVFLGGLPSNVTETDLRVFFARYGTVMEVVIMYDQEKKKSRGFGFLSFQDDASVERVTCEHYINLNGKQVEIKKAEPRDGGGGGQQKMEAMSGVGHHHAIAPMMHGGSGGGGVQHGQHGMSLHGGGHILTGNGGYQGWGNSQPPNYGGGGGGPPQQPTSTGYPGGWNGPPPQQQQHHQGGPHPPHPQWSGYSGGQQSHGGFNYG